jgi:nickel-dependent lactate racemase
MMAARGKLYFKGREQHFDIPAHWNLLAQAEPREACAVSDLKTGVRKALEKPIGMPGLKEAIPAEGDVVIISEDQTRPSPVGRVMEPLVEMLGELGVRDERIQVVIGRGTHRKTTPEELEAKLGRSILDRFQVSIHDVDDTDNLVLMGMTTRETPVWINRKVAEAGLVIAIGTINPHYFAGYGGGAKLILPGVSGRESIVHNHTMIADKNAVQGKMEGNPIWEDMLEAARIARLGMKIDLLLNTRKEVCNIFAGEVEQAQKAAVKALLDIYGLPVPRMADITLTAGYPLETNLIQSGKAVLLANEVTKEGGTIVLLSALNDGAGPLLYETLKEKPEPETVVQWIAEGKASPTGGPISSMLRQLLKKKRLVVVSDGIAKEQIEDMDMAYAPSIEEAIETLSGQYQNPDVIISPVGSSTFPYIAA